jgi:hypothetical protein
MTFFFLQLRCQMLSTCFTAVAVLAMCLSTLAESESDMYQFPSKRLERRYCGSNLVHKLQLLCDGQYNSNTSPNKNYGQRAGRKKSMPGTFSVIVLTMHGSFILVRNWVKEAWKNSELALEQITGPNLTEIKKQIALNSWTPKWWESFAGNLTLKWLSHIKIEL